MKKLLGIVLLFILFLIALAKLGIIPVDEISQPAEREPASVRRRPRPTRPAAAQPAPAPAETVQSSSSQETSTTDQVLGYGVGYTQWKAKQNSSRKLDTINSERNNAISAEK